MNAGWLALALMVVTVAIAGYALLVEVRRRRLKRRIETLEKRGSEERA